MKNKSFDRKPCIILIKYSHKSEKVTNSNPYLRSLIDTLISLCLYLFTLDVNK